MDNNFDEPSQEQEPKSHPKKMKTKLFGMFFFFFYSFGLETTFITYSHRRKNANAHVPQTKCRRMRCARCT
jgi:hypothetical protein